MCRDQTKARLIPLCGRHYISCLFLPPRSPLSYSRCIMCLACHVTVALLSVGSKLPDIRADNSLRTASILCFCETSPNASSHPFSVLLDDQIDIRVTCEKKGGVLICIPSQINPTNTQRFATSGIEELLSTTIHIQNMQIAKSGL